MPDEQPILDPGARALELERDILYVLTDREDNQPLWSLEDLAREMEHREIIVPVRALLRAGLINQTSDGYIFATRAAVRHIQLVGHGVI